MSEPEWVRKTFVKLLEQVCQPHDNTPIYIERIPSSDSQRKYWNIVDRSNVLDGIGLRLHAPIVAGPFPDLDSAKVAYLLIRAARSSA